MADWLIEQGIAETRAILLDGGQVIAARMEWPGTLLAGEVADAVLVHRMAGSRRGTIRFASGQEALADRLPPSASEGATSRYRVTRPALAERDRRKMARAVPTDEDIRPAPTLAQNLPDARIVQRFPSGTWEDLWLEAWSGSVPFDGGELAFFDTAAMTLVDIDGPGSPLALSQAAVPAIAGALRRFDMGGNIGIDFPTLQAKADRKAVDGALAARLEDWPHERTAMNGFGFVQIVARLERPSILQRIHNARRAAAARLLLRNAEMLEGAGDLLMTCHPAIAAKLEEPWLDALRRRTGRAVRVESNPTLALEAGQSQLVSR
ncbi:ribonuclease [Altererythrobacter sp. MTPC7]|uniref:ribonuclease n=1 Tax=Altererythrobacter sp. MTPC7 TaxID=3056567 RepID=UPI0036F23A82